MLKLKQIELLNLHEIVVEVMEPIVYPKVGTVIKSDDIIAKEKANVYYTIATVVKIYEGEAKVTESSDIKTKSLKVGDNLIIPRNQITPLQFPIEGYDSPKLGVINTYAAFAIVNEDI